MLTCSCTWLPLASSNSFRPSLEVDHPPGNKIVGTFLPRWSSRQCFFVPQKPSQLDHDHDHTKDRSKGIPVIVKQFLNRYVNDPTMKVTSKRIWAAASELEENPLSKYPPTTANKKQVTCAYIRCSDYYGFDCYLFTFSSFLICCGHNSRIARFCVIFIFVFCFDFGQFSPSH